MFAKKGLCHLYAQSTLIGAILLLAGLCTACSPKINEQATTLPPMLVVGEQTQKYNLQLDFMKHHFSGLLVVRQTAPGEIRLLGATHFGLSLFDFQIDHQTFTVNNCIEPLNKKKLLRLLEKDFKNIFIGGNAVRIKKKSCTFEERTSGSGFGKTTYYLSTVTNNSPQQVLIKHKWIGLHIQLDLLNEPTN